MTAELVNMTPAAIIARAVRETYGSYLESDYANEPNSFVALEAMSAAASYVRREWGDYGYSLGIVCGQSGAGLFCARHSDGSRFWFVADRYGNVADIPGAPA